jgi:hypothetical protein
MQDHDANHVMRCLTQGDTTAALSALRAIATDGALMASAELGDTSAHQSQSE